jgi:hypothetical protein
MLQFHREGVNNNCVPVILSLRSRDWQEAAGSDKENLQLPDYLRSFAVRVRQLRQRRLSIGH